MNLDYRPPAAEIHDVHAVGEPNLQFHQVAGLVIVNLDAALPKTPLVGGHARAPREGLSEIFFETIR